jgi:hypothetical protein
LETAKLKVEKLNAMSNILDSIDEINRNFATISKSGHFIQSLISEGFTNEEIEKNKDLFNKEIQGSIEKLNMMSNFFKAMYKFSSQKFEESNKLIKDTDEKCLLDLRDLGDLGVDEKEYNITVDIVKYQRMIEID